MTEVSLSQALGGLAAVPHFFIYRLVWNDAKHKYEKTPCFPDGSQYIMDASVPANWLPYDQAVTILAQLRARDGAKAYTLGWWFTADTGYWFLDADNVLNLETGELSTEAVWFQSNLKGAFCEWSSSDRGLHFVGRGTVPEHSCTHKAAGLELYTDDRGIAFGLYDKATGSADSDHTHVISAVAAHWFKPLAPSEHGKGPRPEWRGPTDDAELLRRAMASNSTNGILNGKASFSDLWQRNVAVLAKTYPPDPGSTEQFGASEADGALAMQLAFWTGCDADRMERLMWQSNLKREKWDRANHATYLRELTIDRACAAVSRVLIDKEQVQVLAVATTDATRAASDAWQQRIMQADEDELRNVVVPGIAADGSIAMLDRERLATLLKDRLAVFLIPASIGQCRKMLQSAAVKQIVDVGIPAFATEHVYVEQGDEFFSLTDATELSRTTFQAKYNRAMPEKQNGDKEDAAKWCLERWGMPTVYDAMYLPNREPIFTHEGRQYANLYTPSSLPALSIAYTPKGLAGIQAFAAHLNAFCGGRIEVYSFLLSWMAFNVQNPGVKVRFAPILKGVQGDGKSLITSVLGAAMGERNVASVGPSVVMNTGGFTDWAHGACVIGMEELQMEGKNRYVIANAFKDNITNSRVTINRKGKGLLKIVNISNFIAYTNFNGAVPLEDNDRRWYVVFSPYTSVHDAVKALGLANVEALGKMFDTIFDAARDCAGEIRRWLMEMVIPESFNPNAHAPDTAEKQRMRASGEDEEHAIARQVIATGSYGVSQAVLSTSCLSTAMRAVSIMEGGEVLKTSKLAKMLVDLGYQSYGLVKWDGKPHRVWAISPMTNEELRYHLDTTVTSRVVT